jgi:hypothetical protein
VLPPLALPKAVASNRRSLSSTRARLQCHDVAQGVSRLGSGRAMPWCAAAADNYERSASSLNNRFRSRTSRACLLSNRLRSALPDDQHVSVARGVEHKSQSVRKSIDSAILSCPLALILCGTGARPAGPAPMTTTSVLSAICSSCCSSRCVARRFPTAFNGPILMPIVYRRP